MQLCWRLALLWLVFGHETMASSPAILHVDVTGMTPDEIAALGPNVRTYQVIPDADDPPPLEKQRRLRRPTHVHPLRMADWNIQWNGRTLPLEFADNGYVRCHETIGTWSTCPAGHAVSFRLCLDEEWYTFRGEFHPNLFGSAPKLRRGVVLKDGKPFRTTAGSFSGEGVGHDTAAWT